MGSRCVTAFALTAGIKWDFENFDKLPRDPNFPVFYVNDRTVQIRVQSLQQVELGLVLEDEADFVGDVVGLVALSSNFETTSQAAVVGYVNREEYHAWRQTAQTSNAYPLEML